MKKILIVLVLITSATAFGFKNAETTAEAYKDVKLTVKFSFENIEEGYDHLTKTEVYIDGNLAGTSTTRNQSKDNMVVCSTTKGNHAVRIINYAYYENQWEAHTIANNYSIDCLYEGDVNLKKKNNKIELVFDLDSGTTRKK